MAREKFDYFEALRQIQYGCVVKVNRYEDEIINDESEEDGEEEGEEEEEDTFDSVDSTSEQQPKYKRIRTSSFIPDHNELEKKNAIINRCRDTFSRLEPQRLNQIHKSQGRPSKCRNLLLQYRFDQKRPGREPNSISDLNCHTLNPGQSSSSESNSSNQEMSNLVIQKEPNSFTPNVVLNQNQCRKSTDSENISDKSVSFGPNLLDQSSSLVNDVSLPARKLSESAHSKDTLRNSTKIDAVKPTGSPAPELRTLNPGQSSSSESNSSNQEMSNLVVQEEPNSFTPNVVLNQNQCRKSTDSENISDKSVSFGPNLLDQSSSLVNDVSLLDRKLSESAHSKDTLRNSAKIDAVKPTGSPAPELRISPENATGKLSSNSPNLVDRSSLENLKKPPQSILHRGSISFTQELASARTSDIVRNISYEVPKAGSFNSDGMIIEWRRLKICLTKLSDLLRNQLSGDTNLDQMMSRNCSRLLSPSPQSSIKWHSPFIISADKTIPTPSSGLLTNPENFSRKIPPIAPSLDCAIEELQVDQFGVSANTSQINDSLGTISHSSNRQVEVEDTEIIIQSTIASATKTPNQSNGFCIPGNVNGEVPDKASSLMQRDDNLTLRIQPSTPQEMSATVPVLPTNQNQKKICADVGKLEVSRRTSFTNQIPSGELVTTLEPSNVKQISSYLQMKMGNAETVIKSTIASSGGNINQGVPDNARSLMTGNDNLIPRIQPSTPQETLARVPVFSTNEEQRKIHAHVGQLEVSRRTNIDQVHSSRLVTTLPPSIVPSNIKQGLAHRIPGEASLQWNKSETRKKQSNVSQYYQKKYIHVCVNKIISILTKADISSQTEAINELKADIIEWCMHELHVEDFLIKVVQKTLENCFGNLIAYLQNLVLRIIDEKIQRKFKIIDMPRKIEEIFQEHKTPRTQEAQITSSKPVPGKRKATAKNSKSEYLKKSNNKQSSTQQPNTHQYIVYQSDIQQSIPSTIKPSINLPHPSISTSGDYSYQRWADPQNLPWSYHQNLMQPSHSYHLSTESCQQCHQSTVNQLPQPPHDSHQILSTELIPSSRQQYQRSQIQEMQPVLQQNVHLQKQIMPLQFQYQQFQLQHKAHQDQSQIGYQENPPPPYPRQPFLSMSQQLSQRSEVGASSMRSQNSLPVPLVNNQEVSRMDYSPPVANTAPPPLSHMYSMLATMSQNSNSSNQQYFVGMAAYHQGAPNMSYNTSGETFDRGNSYQNPHLPARNLDQSSNYQNSNSAEQFQYNSLQLHDKQPEKTSSKQNSLEQPSSNSLEDAVIREMLESYLVYAYNKSDIPDVLGNSPDESNITPSYNFSNY